MSRAIELLQAARNGGYALGAFNAVNLETAQAIVWAAEAENSPVILQVSQNAARYAGLGALTSIAKQLRASAQVPVMLHFDHAEGFAAAQQALNLGYDSVMLESQDEYDLKRLVQIAKPLQAAVEAEFEVVEKGQRGSSERDSQDLAGFVERTGCHWVAVNIGTHHKQTQKTAQLDLERLQQLAAQTPAPLVLHGSSGVCEAELSKAVQLGIAKVNLATELSLYFTEAVRASLQDPNLHDPRKYLGKAREAMQARVRSLIRILRTNVAVSEKA